MRMSSSHAAESQSIEPRSCQLFLGDIVEYRLATVWQKEAVDAVQGGAPDCLFVLQHSPVITLGTSADERHILANDIELQKNRITVCKTNRGGDVTHHNPGQWVAYPVLKLQGAEKDVGKYVRSLEEWMILTVAEFGVKAHRTDGLTGVWVGPKKIAAIGVRLSRWTTSHGVALNVSNDLSGFHLIVPCGIVGRGVTSLAEILGRQTPSMPMVRDLLLRNFEIVFNRKLAICPISSKSSLSIPGDAIGQSRHGYEFPYA